MESHRDSHVSGVLGISQGICCLKAAEVFYLGLVGFEVVHVLQEPWRYREFCAPKLPPFRCVWGPVRKSQLLRVRAAGK